MSENVPVSDPLKHLPTLEEQLAEIQKWYPPVWRAEDIPPDGFMSGPPPEPPPSSEPEPRDIFYRLKWSILDPPSDVQIFERDDSGVLAWRPLLSTPLADESAYTPPKSRLEVTIEPVQSWDHWRDHGIEHNCPGRPAPLVIENVDGQAITFKQYISAVHEYALPFRNYLLRIEDIQDPANWGRARFFFDHSMMENSIYVVADPDGSGEECKHIWEHVETEAKTQSASG